MRPSPRDRSRVGSQDTPSPRSNGALRAQPHDAEIASGTARSAGPVGGDWRYGRPRRGWPNGDRASVARWVASAPNLRYSGGRTWSSGRCTCPGEPAAPRAPPVDTGSPNWRRRRVGRWGPRSGGFRAVRRDLPGRRRGAGRAGRGPRRRLRGRDGPRRPPKVDRALRADPGPPARGEQRRRSRVLGPESSSRDEGRGTRDERTVLSRPSSLDSRLRKERFLERDQREPPRSAGRRTRLWPGKPYPLGATWDGQGTNFALFSENADRGRAVPVRRAGQIRARA